MNANSRKIFFDDYRSYLDTDRRLSQREVDALDNFINLSYDTLDMFSIPQWSYVYATAFHETAHTFEPVKEAYWLSEEWRKNNLRYYPYYGRGFVQITWKSNYQKYSDILGVDLVSNPDLALREDIAFYILIDGFQKGLFTGKKISDYVNDKEKDYYNARRCINGRDKATLIKNYALTFESILDKCL